MSFKGEFAEILEKKMGSPLSEEKNPPRLQPIKSPSVDWILPIFASRKIWTPHKIPSIYPKIMKKSRISTAPHAISQQARNDEPEETFQVNQLSRKGQKALKIFERLGANFKETQSFRASELKTQYRRLARIYHPDSQSEKASSKYFNMCSICYKMISKELMNS